MVRSPGAGAAGGETEAARRDQGRRASAVGNVPMAAAARGEDMGMRGFLERASVCFAAGVFGALVASFGLWLAGWYGWTAALGVSLSPPWEAAWIHPRLIWGGLWGLLFLPRFLEYSILWRGLLLSLGPSLAQLLALFPLPGDTGAWAVLFVLGSNALWGWAAAAWVLTAAGDGRQHYQRLR